jgi:hypothetical protein
MPVSRADETPPVCIYLGERAVKMRVERAQAAAPICTRPEKWTDRLRNEETEQQFWAKEFSSPQQLLFEAFNIIFGNLAEFICAR